MANETLTKSKRTGQRTSTELRTKNSVNNIHRSEPLPALKELLFSDLPEQVMDKLEATASTVAYPKGAVLVHEGHEVRGVFVVCEGRVKLSTSSRNGKSVILRIAERGDIIGLPGTISGQPSQATAETLEPVHARFIGRTDFLHFMRQNGEAAIRVTELLNAILSVFYQRVRCLGLSNSAAERMVRFLLALVTKTGSLTSEDGHFRIPLLVTHEEIGQMIGISRETVTRLLLDFRRQRLITISEPGAAVLSKPGLEKILKVQHNRI